MYIYAIVEGETHAQHTPRPFHTLSDAMSKRRRGQPWAPSEAVTRRALNLCRVVSCAVLRKHPHAWTRSPPWVEPTSCVGPIAAAHSSDHAAAAYTYGFDQTHKLPWRAALGGSGAKHNTKELAMKGVDDDKLPDYATARAVGHDGSSVTVGSARAVRAAACVAGHRVNEFLFNGEPASRFAVAATRASWSPICDQEKQVCQPKVELSTLMLAARLV